MNVDELHAHLEIQQLKHRYCWCLDARDADELTNLFTPDGVCEFGSFGSASGVDKIRERFQTSFADKSPFEVMHVVANPIIEVAGNAASGRWYVTAMQATDSRADPVQLLAIYHDDFRRVDGLWRIAAVRIEYVWWADRGNPR